jgi:hypothetical protein
VGFAFARTKTHRLKPAPPKPATFTRAVKIAAPENSTQTRKLGPPARKLEMNLNSDLARALGRKESLIFLGMSKSAIIRDPIRWGYQEAAW